MTKEEFIQGSLEYPRNFLYSGQRPLCVKGSGAWGFSSFTSTPMDGLVQMSNWAVISKDLRRRFPRQTEILFSSHWACGSVEQVILQVYTKKGALTKAFEAAWEWHLKLEDYPLADEDHYNVLCYVKALRNINDRIPAGANPAKVFSWLGNNGYENELEEGEDGAYPSDESLAAAVLALYPSLPDVGEAS